MSEGKTGMESQKTALIEGSRGIQWRRGFSGEGGWLFSRRDKTASKQCLPCFGGKKIFLLFL